MATDAEFHSAAVSSVGVVMCSCIIVIIICICFPASVAMVTVTLRGDGHSVQSRSLLVGYCWEITGLALDWSRFDVDKFVTLQMFKKGIKNLRNLLLLLPFSRTTMMLHFELKKIWFCWHRINILTFAQIWFHNCIIISVNRTSHFVQNCRLQNSVTIIYLLFITGNIHATKN